MGLFDRIKKKVKDVVLAPEPPPPEPSRRVSPPPVHSAPPEPESPRGDMEPREYIDGLVKEHQVVLFMKGSPAAPQCGFSANAVGILANYDVVPHTVDILIDPEVRQEVKEYSGWPTIPQIYVKGELVGGSDILSQLHENGELKALFEG